MLIKWSEKASYSFSAPVCDLAVDLRMQCLAVWGRTAVVDLVTVTPEPAARKATSDIFGNAVIELTFDRPVQRLVVSGYHRASCCAEEPFAAPLLPMDLALEDEARKENSTIGRGDPTVSLHDVATIVREVRRGWRYNASITGLRRPLSDIDASRRGVCQDIARLAVDLMRRRGIPARYVVGYAVPRDRRIRVLRHAWIAAHVDGGWREVDVADLRDELRPLAATAWGSALAAIGPVIGRSPVRAQTQLTVDAQAELENKPTAG